MKNAFLLFGLLLLLTACARNKAIAPEEPEQPTIPLASITLVPVAAPDTLFTNNRSAPTIGWLWVGLANTVLDKSKSAEFDARYGEYRKRIGERLTQSVQRELIAQGFSVRLANASDVERDADQVLKMRRLQGYDAVLDVRIDEIAMYSRRLDPNYLPTITTSAALFRPSFAHSPVFDAWYSYGAYADKTGDGYIQSDPKYAFPNFEALIGQPALVTESFDDGLDKIAKHLVQDFRKQYRPAAPPVLVSATQAPSSAASEATASATPTATPKKQAKAAKTARRPAASAAQSPAR